MGTLGTGKSTLLNTMGASFVTSDGEDCCTQTLERNNTVPGLVLIDSPGLHDMDMSMLEWAAKLNTSALAGAPLDVCLLVFQQVPRP